VTIIILATLQILITVDLAGRPRLNSTRLGNMQRMALIKLAV